MTKKVGVLTGGGDCPGLNAVIRAVVRRSVFHGSYEIVGLKHGWRGLVEMDTRPLARLDVTGILYRGGTILGTSRTNIFKDEDTTRKAIDNFRKLELDALIAIGGEDTLGVARRLYHEYKINVVGVPKTIDNDLPGTDVTFGFDTALTTATEAVDKLHSTAQSHHRVMVVETMGRYAGWLALYSGLAGGGDVVLIPEIPYSIEKVCETVLKRQKGGRPFSIIVVSEGAKPIGGDVTVKRIVKDSPDPVRLGGVGNLVGRQIETRTGLETRVTVLGHLQRGGTPTPYDRILASQLGEAAVRLVGEESFGQMVNIRGNQIGSIALEEIAGQTRNVPVNSPVIATARALGMSFGD
jgi:phosphofructokinase-like protein